MSLRIRVSFLALAAALLGAAWAAQAAPPPVADFFGPSAFGGAQLSPNGRYVAAKVPGASGRDRLAVVELATSKAQVVAEFSDGDIGDFQWVNDDRLLFDSTDKDVGAGDVTAAPGLFAVDRDGRNFRQLAQRRADFITTPAASKLLPWHTYMMPQRGAQDSDAVYVQSVNFAPGGGVRSTQLLRLDTRTGRSSGVPQPGSVQQWMLDARGEPRMATTLEDGKNTIWLRDDKMGDKWRPITTFDAWIAEAGGFSPLDFDSEGRLYVAARHGSDKTAVHTFDLAAGKIDPVPRFSVQRYDFSGRLIRSGGKLVGVRYLGDSYATEWLDPDLKALQETVDAKLPGLVNLISIPRRPESPFVLVTTYSDMQPRVYFVYNRETGKLTVLAQSQPKLDATKMGRQQLVSYPARDGMQIPVLLTLPNGAKTTDRLPMVVLVHGGPWVRGVTWGWSADAQFLASRGYAVLEPDFRGSTGHGAKHLTAGFKQWGRAMQDDVTDGTRWAIEQGIADPQRICIAGASYGGYATLMGLIREPDLYRCGVNWVGVTDIRLMYGGSWFHTSDLPPQYIRYGMPRLIGDLEKDADQLMAVSPVEQASRLHQPLLMAYGGADRRVPRAHGTRFRDAVGATNKNVEWIEYPEEGHGWRLAKNRIDFWTRVEKFLDRNIGSGAAGPKQAD
ncbi:prolyl oligopeptidase family serine peptidase [Massilia dura]|uniref:Prolyl oligopeptidase family serine peptidase n=1 Tax=Pseudoduganella dura TaxID=321982 RepID=A0A6I3XEJ4_9BURK|nr:prolyl oligopeptidase family serine peptidase [Pseudoduganella dura]MUI14016.1 prolyl oligopeptidase family serine peptidase [Pseudoduganella dura]GGX91921.1 peptidase [Pseudoduganella dura]